MLKTNNKQVKKYFDEYLAQILRDSFEGNIEKMQAQFVAGATDSRGKLARIYSDGKIPTYQEEFKFITFNYGETYFDDMRDILAEALEETPEEASAYNPDKVEHLFNYLLYSAYLRAIEKAGFPISRGFKY